MIKRDNTLSNNISITRKDPTGDSACKKLLTEKQVLSWILQKCVDEYKYIPVKDIQQKYLNGEIDISLVSVHQDEPDNIKPLNSEDNSISEGKILYDIRFDVVIPINGEIIKLIINIEAQGVSNPGYPLVKRGLYYCSRLISAQKNTYFTNSHYENIHKVYSIWICMSPPEEAQNTITKYCIRKEDVEGYVCEDLKNYDLFTVVMLRLSNNATNNEILYLLNTLFRNSDAEKVKQILVNDFNMTMTEELEEGVTEVCDYAKVHLNIGIDEGVFRSLKNLILNTNWDTDKALRVLSVPEDKHEIYTQKLLDEGIIKL